MKALVGAFSVITNLQRVPSFHSSSSVLLSTIAGHLSGWVLRAAATGHCWPGDLHPARTVTPPAPIVITTTLTSIQSRGVPSDPYIRYICDWFIFINIVYRTVSFLPSIYSGECRLHVLMLWENWVSILTEIVKTCGIFLTFPILSLLIKCATFNFHEPA